MKIGVYSGSFDPIHIGHAMVANYCSQWGGLDEVWLMVSPMNPLKEGSRPSDTCHRMAMAELVARECRCVKASDFELHLPLPSYTYVTLCKLREAFPEHEFKLIIGSDNWVYFGRWRDAHKIIKEFGIIVYPRPGFAVPSQIQDGVEVLPEGPTAHVSSTFVRNCVVEKSNINFFVPLAVAQYIQENGLYRNDNAE